LQLCAPTQKTCAGSAGGKTGGVKRSFDFSTINSAINSTPTRGKSANPVAGGGGSVLSTLIAPNSNTNSTFSSFGNSIGSGFGFDDVATNADGDGDDDNVGDDLPEITAEAALPFRATYCEIEGRRHAIIILKNTPPVAKEEITFSVDHATVSVIFPEPKVGEQEMDRFLAGAQRKLGVVGTKASIMRAIRDDRRRRQRGSQLHVHVQRRLRHRWIADLLGDSGFASGQQPAEPLQSGHVDRARDAEVSRECHCGRRDLMEVKYQTSQVCFTPFYLTSSVKEQNSFVESSLS
jgi:hypothetical protein